MNVSVRNIRALTLARVGAATAVSPVRKFGRIVRSNGEVLHVSGIRAPIGARCLIEAEGEAELPAEVVGFEAEGLLVMPEQGTRGIVRGARVYIDRATAAPHVGDGLLGRIIDARGEPLDGMPLPEMKGTWPLLGVPINPMERTRIEKVFDVGVSAINALHTMGRGMRIGLFAGSGVGKTTLLGMMARHSKADVVVVAMIGERGREIREFIEDQIGSARARSVVVASPADDTALGRVHGAYRAAAIAEFFRDKGKHVLLVVDSLTRLAMALREIGIAAGEPGTTKGYPPSVFSAVPAYVERSGNGSASQGSITAIYTVLVEGDDHVADPVADTARSVLDGHIVLSRAMSEAALYPPIDVTASLSRPMPSLVTDEHHAQASKFRTLWARKAEKQDIIDIGRYAAGRDLLLDEALRRLPSMESVIRQDMNGGVTFEQSYASLNRALAD